jgi:ABC-type bacteriocin/lantibiotic exporter with double-glycine peptidase domain
MNRRKPMTPVWLAITCWILLCSCETLPVQGSNRIQEDAQRDFIQGPGEPDGSMKRHVHLVVPFFPDNADQCGPATLASLLSYWGIPSDPRTLKEEIYLRRLRGTLPIDLLLSAQARGLQAEGAGGTLDRVKTELAADRPVVALLNLGWTVYPRGHYVVVTGYDEQRQGVYLHSGMARDVFVPYEAFLNKWEKSGRWMLQMRPAKHHDSAHE